MHEEFIMAKSLRQLLKRQKGMNILGFGSLNDYYEMAIKEFIFDGI